MVRLRVQTRRARRAVPLQRLGVWTVRAERKRKMPLKQEVEIRWDAATVMVRVGGGRGGAEKALRRDVRWGAPCKWKRCLLFSGVTLV